MADGQMATDANQQTRRVTGKLWTLLTFTALFVAVYLGAYWYVIPRLGQEMVSSTSSLQFRASATTEKQGWTKTKLRNSDVRYVSPEACLMPQHFETFRYLYDSATPSVELFFSRAGGKQVQALKAEPNVSTIVCFVNGTPVAEVNLQDVDSESLVFSVDGMPGGDVNELLARLTE